VETPELILTEIENLYLECKEKTTYGSDCKDKLKDMMDKYCRIITDSQSDYDVCFGAITKIIQS